jgi:hypothetical protein
MRILMHWRVFVNPLAFWAFIWYSMDGASRSTMMRQGREETA